MDLGLEDPQEKASGPFVQAQGVAGLGGVAVKAVVGEGHHPLPARKPGRVQGVEVQGDVPQGQGVEPDLENELRGPGLRPQDLHALGLPADEAGRVQVQNQGAEGPSLGASAP